MNDAWRAFVDGFGSAATSSAFALSAAFAIAAIALYHFGIARRRFGKAPMTGARASIAGLAPDAPDLRDRIAALEAATAGALQHVGFVRFNAFPDVASELSYALAVVDGRGDGFVVSSIYSREEVRTYAKAVRQFAADKEMSLEERQALQIARRRGGAEGPSLQSVHRRTGDT